MSVTALLVQASTVEQAKAALGRSFRSCRRAVPGNNGRMARIRLSGGIVLGGDQRVWLADRPGHEVDGSRPYPGAPVVVGPADARRADVDRARREAQHLLADGGALVAAAGVDVGGGFRTARLEGGGETRREAVLAAAELLGPDGLARIGSRDSVLVALFGTRATKRVGAAAVDALAGDSRAALRLAVAASDVLGPEQLEQVLRFEAPAGMDPLPQGTTGLLSSQLTTILAPYPARRRLALVRSLWEEVVAWPQSAAARGRAHRRGFSSTAGDELLKEVREADDRWWRQQASCQLADRSDAASLLRWVPGPAVWAAGLQRAYQECVAAAVLVRTAVAAEVDPVEDAVLAHLAQLAFAGSAHVHDLENRVEAVDRVVRPSGVAADRAWCLAGLVFLASKPSRVSSMYEPAWLAGHLHDTCELAVAVLKSSVDLINAVRGIPIAPGDPAVMLEWRRLAGFGRDPHVWWDAIDGHPPLGTRLEDGGDPALVERIEDALWLADLADVVNWWFGQEAVTLGVQDYAWVDVDPVEPDPDLRVPSAESVALAVAGAAQLVAVGAQPGARPATWPALIADLVADAERLGLDEKLTVPGDVTTWEGKVLPGTELGVQVARSAKQLTGWGNYMGNCIAGYASEASRRFALVALRDGSGRLVANVSVHRRGARWQVGQALARFNEPLAPELDELIVRWAHELRVPDAGPARAPVPAPRGPRPRGEGRRQRPAPRRDALLRASTALGETIGELHADPRTGWARDVVCPIAAELGWAGDADQLGPFVAMARLRRPGPLAEAIGRALDAGVPLAELWEATASRPLAEAVERLPELEPDLRRLVGAAVPPSLRLALRDPRVSGARTVDLAAWRLRVALFELLAAGDARLDRAVAARPHTGFVAAAALTLTAAQESGGDRHERIPVAPDGSLPGRPRTTLAGAGSPWTDALLPAQELGVTPARLDEVLADAPGRHLLVPAAWTAPRGWSAFWGRAHRVTREVRRTVPATPPAAS